jgi:hypothetical protein
MFSTALLRRLGNHAKGCRRAYECDLPSRRTVSAWLEEQYRHDPPATANRKVLGQASVVIPLSESNVMYTARRAKYSGCCVLICSQNSPESALQSGLQADALDRKTGINFS